ncbi:MAG TPA: hypothetical protein ENI42_04425, partial [Thermoplasmatales archaeon]|nr:hypothetical protein [Thermoplasmatales archaeon]
MKKNRWVYTIICMLFVSTALSGFLVDNQCKGNSLSKSAEWSIEIVDDEGDVGLHSSLVVDNSGAQLCSYYDKTNGDLKYAVYNGENWVIQTVDSEGDVGLYTSLDLDINGNPCISYYDNTNHDLKYAWWDNLEETWVIETVDGTGDVGWSTSLAIDSENKPHISYYDFTNQKLKYATFTPDTGWVTMVVDDGGLYTAIDVKNDGIPCIAYTGLNGGLKYAEYVEEEGWITLLVDSDAEGWDVSLDVDSSNRIHISYYGNNYLKYAVGEDLEFPVEEVDYVTYGGWGSSIDTYNGTPSISYYDYMNKDLRYAKKTLGEWVTETVDAEGDVGQHSSLYLKNGFAHITYYDATNGCLKKGIEGVIEEGLLIDAVFQPVQVVYQDDPLYGNDLKGGPCVWIANLSMVAGKNTYLFGYPYKDRNTIKIKVHNNYPDKKFFRFVLKIYPDNKKIWNSTLLNVSGISKKTFSFSAPLPPKPFKWERWGDTPKSKEGSIVLSLEPDIAGPPADCNCTQVTVKVKVLSTHDLKVLFVPFTFGDGPDFPPDLSKPLEFTLFDFWRTFTLEPWWNAIYPVREKGLDTWYNSTIKQNVEFTYGTTKIKVNNLTTLNGLTKDQLDKLQDAMLAKALAIGWIGKWDRVVLLVHPKVLSKTGGTNGLSYRILPTGPTAG